MIVAICEVDPVPRLSQAYVYIDPVPLGVTTFVVPLAVYVVDVL